MEVKPGYKLTDVGVIPEDWEIKSFGELFEFRNGVNADKNAYGEGVRFINVLEPITCSHLHGQDIPGRVSLPERIINHYAVKKGDVIFNRTSETESEIGLAATYLDSEVVVFGGFVIRGRPIFQALDPLYSGYAFRAPFIRSQIVPMGQGAVRANIGQQSLGKVLAPIPPYEDQRAIASVLSDMDALLDTLDRLIAKKCAIKQSAMQKILAGHIRLPGFSGEWEVKTLGDVVDHFVGGGTPSRANPAYWGNEIPWVTVKDFATFNPFQAQEGITRLGLCNSASNLIPAGTLITSVRMTLGKAVVYQVDVAINQDMKALFLNSDVTVDFLFHWFSCYGEHIDDIGSGSTVKGISVNELKRLEISFPKKNEQTAIATVLTDMDAEIIALETRRAKTRALKQAMMQELLTGKTRLI
ncbi:restriction endonuclease subunit S [Xanthomonas campestris pv. raphani]|uniref:restriction endonuclease subunit S n=1 Tax=Xanthomonas campestris TaxID=339 RepID=UPI0009B6C5FB|nr:restriction endonuclease subunit S [Xanthomonas campestris]MEA9676620.1 restriction endonuclease subunit S [Xanthomonas campestris pv. raphani]MEA9776409.1 restriction endonuclease subunit S [Xanthomonas campestris pv. raphani]MEA9918707.1 restriction endonuclease subunit S [Xanthomonas campestris pv. raphani]